MKKVFVLIVMITVLSLMACDTVTNRKDENIQYSLVGIWEAKYYDSKNDEYYSYINVFYNDSTGKSYNFRKDSLLLDHTFIWQIDNNLLCIKFPNEIKECYVFKISENKLCYSDDCYDKIDALPNNN